MIELSDELLMAYVDGQLDKPQTTVVSRLVRDDEELTRRIIRLQQTQARLLETFGTLLREGAAAAKSQRNARSMNRRYLNGNLFQAGAIAVLVLIGVLIGWGVSHYTGSEADLVHESAALQMPPANWSEDIAQLHAFFTNDTVSVSPDSQTNPEVVGFQLAKLSKELALPDLTNHGLKFTRGQLMNYRGHKLMQLIYTNKGEPLLAIYIAPGGADVAATPGEFGDVKTMSWEAQGLRFVIASNMPPEALRTLVGTIQEQQGKS
jgi:anti-sigma factor RsiW